MPSCRPAVLKKGARNRLFRHVPIPPKNSSGTTTAGARRETPWWGVPVESLLNPGTFESRKDILGKILAELAPSLPQVTVYGLTWLMLNRLRLDGAQVF
jgi:hypothetical protein